MESTITSRRPTIDAQTECQNHHSPRPKGCELLAADNDSVSTVLVGLS